jgi:hypothetical protein
MTRRMVLNLPSSNTHLIHGQSQEEASSANEQAQAPEALEGSSPQEAHVAKVTLGRVRPPSEYLGSRGVNKLVSPLSC